MAISTVVGSVNVGSKVRFHGNTKPKTKEVKYGALKVSRKNQTGVVTVQSVKTGRFYNLPASKKVMTVK